MAKPGSPSSPAPGADDTLAKAALVCPVKVSPQSLYEAGNGAATPPKTRKIVAEQNSGLPDITLYLCDFPFS